jgi:ketosteroid isomerase-like protein
MPDVRELLDANLHRVFGNRDDAARRLVIDDIYTEDVSFTEPEGTVRGRDALDERAAALLGRTPADFEFVEDGPCYISASMGALAWRFGPLAAPVARGIDVITVRDGRISELRTMLTSEG